MKIAAIFAEHWNRLKPFDKNVLGFWFLLIILLVLFFQNLQNAFLEIFLHIAVILVTFILLVVYDEKGGRIRHFLRYWYIVLILPLIYWDIGTLVHLVYPDIFDHLVVDFEILLFGVSPNIWIQNYIYPLLTEIMQISYGIYWITIPLGGAIFYFNKQFKHYEQLLKYITYTFFFSYFCFIFFPVAGPRFFMADQITASYEGLFLTGLLRQFVVNAGFRGGAFPSSHVGVAVTILIFIWHYKPRVARRLFLPLVIALSIATVYGQYHYLSDVIGGLVLGLFIGFRGGRKSKKLLQNE